MGLSHRPSLFGLLLVGLTAGLMTSEVPALALQEPMLRFPEPGLGLDALANRRLRAIDIREKPLRQARETLAPCAEMACITPSEAAAMAHNAGPDQVVRGRFILDVRAVTGPGDRFQPPIDNLFYLGSERDFRLFGTLVVAIERDALDGVLNGETVADGTARRIPATSGRMRKHLSGQRVIVDGEARLQWVEFPDWETGQRNGTGYHQVWVRVTSPDQVRIVES